jgi:hypothetical protein
MQSPADTRSAAPAGARAVSIQGVAHGGQQPLIGAHVYLYAVGTGGYGKASQSLLLPGVTTAADGNGQYYTTTDATGSFSVTGDYLCTAGTQVYVYVLGGDPQLGSGSNSASGLMAALGACPATKTLALTVPEVTVNEVSTVVMAYALAGFGVDGQHIASSGTALAATGVANAMSTALNLVNVATGMVGATTAAGNGQAPVGAIYAVANVLAACVNSAGPGSMACGNLESLTGAASTTDTAAIAFDIAHAPFNNVAALYDLGAATGPFQPAATTAPQDFTVNVRYLTPAYQNKGEDFGGTAIDAGGNVWTFGYSAGFTSSLSLISYSPVGAVRVNQAVSGSGELPGYLPLSIDGNGNVWLQGFTLTDNGNSNTGQFYKYSNQGTLLSPAAGYMCPDMQDVYGITFDTSGNAYIGDVENTNNSSASYVWQVLQADGSCVSKLSTGGGPYFTPAIVQADSLGEVFTFNFGNYVNFGVGFTGATGFSNGSDGFVFAIDGSNNLWAPGDTVNMVKTSRTGDYLSPDSGYSFGLSSSAGGYAIIANGPPPVIDGAGAVWMPVSFSTTPVNGMSTGYDLIAAMTNAGVPITPASGVGQGDFTNGGVAIDGSGNIWGVDYGGSLEEFIGLATPVATPVLMNQLGTRP